jgi:hypothetical protein
LKRKMKKSFPDAGTTVTAIILPQDTDATEQVTSSVKGIPGHMYKLLLSTKDTGINYYCLPFSEWATGNRDCQG